MEYKSFASAIMAIFGKQPGQSLGEFQAEIKELTEKDRQDIINGLAGNGITITGQPATGVY